MPLGVGSYNWGLFLFFIFSKIKKHVQLVIYLISLIHMWSSWFYHTTPEMSALLKIYTWPF